MTDTLSGMEFFLGAILMLSFLALGALVLVEAFFLLGRFCSRVSFWLRYRFPTWRSGRYVARLKRRQTGKAGSRLGRLRFTKSRAEQFGKKGS